MADCSYRLDPNAYQNSVPGTGSSKQLGFGYYQQGSNSPVPGTYTALMLPDGVYVATLYVPWPYSASGAVRGIYLKYAGVDYAGDERGPDSNHDADTVTTLLVGAGDLTSYAYQNSGSSLNFVGSWIKVQQLA